MNNIFKRHNVSISGQAPGSGRPTMVFAHGFGCDQHMWRFVAPAFEATHPVLLFDHMGCGKADSKAYDATRHARLEGYAQDVVQIFEAADLTDAIFIGHSVSSIIGLLASIQAPQRIARMVMVCPSPRYLNDSPDYYGGFERSDIDGLIDMMESNLVGWANFLAPAVMGADGAGELTDELKASICRADPYISRCFAAATFLGDNRQDLPQVQAPSLIIQCSDDAIAPQAVGDYMHRQLRGSQLATIEASGHCPHMTHAEETIALIRDYLVAH